MAEKLSPEVLKILRDTPPKTKEQLGNWILVHLGVYLASVPIEEGNSSPMDFVWDVYQRNVLNQTQDGKTRVLGMASRGSQKTLSCSVLEFLCLLFDKNRDIVHLAAIDRQAQVCYGYVQRYSSKDLFNPEKIVSTIMNETKSYSGRTLAVTVGTMNSVNALHAGLLIFDEVDLLPKKIFSESHGMISSTSFASGLFVYISSRKMSFGNIEDLLTLSAAPDSNIKVHRWGALEITEECPDTRSGPFGTTYYVDEANLIALTEAEYNREFNRLKFVPIQGYAGCGQCGIFSFCKGNLKKKKSFNPYYTKIEDLCSQFKSEDHDFFSSQRLNKKPSKIGLVYPDYDDQKHVKTYAEMYEIFAGEKHPLTATQNDISLDILVKAFSTAGCQFYLGVDFGFTDPFVALLIVIDGKQNVYVIDHITLVGTKDSDCILACYNRWQNIAMTIVADTENPSGIKEFRDKINEKQVPWFVSGNTEKDIDLGTGLVRNFLRTPGTTQTRLAIHNSIKILISEFKVHHYQIRKSDGVVLDKPDDSSNHALDALRYPIATLFSRHASSLVTGIPIQVNNPNQAVLDASPKTLSNQLGITDANILTEQDVKDGIENKEPFPQGGNKGGSGFSWGFC